MIAARFSGLSRCSARSYCHDFASDRIFERRPPRQEVDRVQIDGLSLSCFPPQLVAEPLEIAVGPLRQSLPAAPLMLTTLR